MAVTVRALLAELEGLDHHRRVVRMVELGRASRTDPGVRGLLAGMADADWYQRHLAVHAGYGSGDAVAARRAAADASRSVRGVALGLLAHIGDDDLLAELLGGLAGAGSPSACPPTRATPPASPGCGAAPRGRGGAVSAPGWPAAGGAGWSTPSCAGWRPAAIPPRFACSAPPPRRPPLPWRPHCSTPRAGPTGTAWPSSTRTWWPPPCDRPPTGWPHRTSGSPAAPERCSPRWASATRTSRCGSSPSWTRTWCSRRCSGWPCAGRRRSPTSCSPPPGGRTSRP